MRFIKSLFAALAVFASFQSNGQAYVPDPNFAGSGVFSETSVTGFAYNSAALQSDGKIVLARVGAIIRLNPDGTLDSTFADNGRYQVDLWFDKVLNQPDGKILACGSRRSSGIGHSIITRLLPDGTPDLSFGTAGLIEVAVDTVMDVFNSMVLAPDGSIYTVGNYSIYYTMLVKFNADGQLDSSFGTEGIVRDTLTYFSDIKMDDAGRLLVCGYYGSASFLEQAVLVKYLPHGGRDPLFGNLGVLMSGTHKAWWYSALTILPDGDIISSGFYGTGEKMVDFMTCRYHADGKVDSGFGINGMAVYDVSANEDYVYGMTIESDKIILAGLTFYNNPWGQTPSIMRLNMDGTLDTTFSNSGIMYNTTGEDGKYYGVLVGSEGKLLAYGNDREKVFPYNDGHPLIRRFYDPSVSVVDRPKHNSITIFPNPTAREVSITGTEKSHVIIASYAGKKLIEANDSTIDISHLADGIYIISVFDTKHNLLKTEKLVKRSE